MIGRGAVGAPWIFHQLKTGSVDIDNNVKHAIIMEHFDKMIEFYGPHGVAMFRKHTHTYSKGYRGASALRNSVNSICDIHEYRAVIDDFFSKNEIIC
jgi:tRNA-dihydrouridine synthase B